MFHQIESMVEKNEEFVFLAFLGAQEAELEHRSKHPRIVQTDLQLLFKISDGSFQALTGELGIDPRALCMQSYGNYRPSPIVQAFLYQ